MLTRKLRSTHILWFKRHYQNWRSSQGHMQTNHVHFKCGSI